MLASSSAEVTACQNKYIFEYVRIAPTVQPHLDKPESPDFPDEI
jgi:hypothetical protein